MQLEKIPCPKCNTDFPLKRKELGFHVCVNCSTVKPVVGITTVEGTGDHTYNDLIIMDQDRARAISKKSAELSGHRVYLEILDYDIDESDVERQVKEKVIKVVGDDDFEEEEQEDQESENGLVEGIDY